MSAIVATLDSSEVAARLGLNTIDPLADRRWAELASNHLDASVFHQPGWLKALAETYGYRVLALTSAAAGRPLHDGIVLCRISSWLTGTRLVSLPFSDHCQPLLSSADQITCFMEWLRAACDGWRSEYIELRPRECSSKPRFGFRPGATYCFHKLDLRKPIDELFRGLHRNSIQRKIRRAERERLVYEDGRSPKLLMEFYGLLLKTRRRHHLLPQPLRWFRNLLLCLGENCRISIARKDGVPIAALLTLRHRTSVVYKYGCSDERFHNTGPMPMLFWKLIEASKESGAEELDFGRSDIDHHGLITFKDRLGAQKMSLTYLRYSDGQQRNGLGWGQEVIRKFVSLAPDAALPIAGSALYRHLG